MSEHECEHEGQPQQVVYSLPAWRWSTWDLAGIVVTTVGGLFTVIGQGANLLSRECAASANYSRQNQDLREAQEQYEANQARMAEELRDLVEGPEEMAFDETGGEDES